MSEMSICSIDLDISSTEKGMLQKDHQFWSKLSFLMSIHKLLTQEIRTTC